VKNKMFSLLRRSKTLRYGSPPISMSIYTVAPYGKLLLRPVHALWVFLIEKLELSLTHTFTRCGVPPS
jgi:hypothetical protein